MGTTRVNINQVERIGSAALGGVLGIWSLKRPSPGRVALAIDLLYRGISGHSYLYQALGVSTVDRNQRARERRSIPPTTECTITIGKSAEELYRLWRNPQQRSQLLGDFASVTEVSEDREHWRVGRPQGRNMEWDAQIVEDRPGEFLRWKSLENSPLPNEGWISFQTAPGARGTEVKLHFHFNPPGGLLGKSIAKRLGVVPHFFAEKTLRRLKSLAETGEFPTLAHNPSARPSSQFQTLLRPRAQTREVAQAYS